MRPFRRERGRRRFLADGFCGVPAAGEHGIVFVAEVIVEEFREGFYKDKYGDWQPERRKQGDRRAPVKIEPQNHERRKMFRRKADREELYQARDLINEALEDFAEKHDGHL